MQTVITGQTTLENGLKVFSVCHIDGTKETREEFVYKTPSDVLRRLRRDRLSALPNFECDRMTAAEFQSTWRG
jgi:hypothetical protein